MDVKLVKPGFTYIPNEILSESLMQALLESGKFYDSITETGAPANADSHISILEKANALKDLYIFLSKNKP